LEFDERPPLWGGCPEGAGEVQYAATICTVFGELVRKHLIRQKNRFRRAVFSATFPKGEGLGAAAPQQPTEFVYPEA